MTRGELLSTVAVMTGPDCLNGATAFAGVASQGRRWAGHDAEIYEGGGSTVTFVIDGLKFTIDRPHPRRECGIGLVKRVRRYLEKIGRI